MTKKELIDAMSDFDDDSVVIIMDESEGWDNIKSVERLGSLITIVFGGGSPFKSEHN